MEDVCQIINILNSFAKASSQNINLTKSALYAGVNWILIQKVVFMIWLKFLYGIILGNICVYQMNGVAKKYKA